LQHKEFQLTHSDPGSSTLKTCGILSLNAGFAVLFSPIASVSLEMRQAAVSHSQVSPEPCSLFSQEY